MFAGVLHGLFPYVVIEICDVQRVSCYPYRIIKKKVVFRSNGDGEGWLSLEAGSPNGTLGLSTLSRETTISREKSFLKKTRNEFVISFLQADGNNIGHNWLISEFAGLVNFRRGAVCLIQCMTHEQQERFFSEHSQTLRRKELESDPDSN
jgi:hypothetical protein